MRTVLWVLLFLAVTAAGETSPGYHFANSAQNVVGEIVKLEGTRVHVREEWGFETFRFFAHSRTLEEFKVGDRVRVYFYPNDRFLVSIKKMTPVECGEGQNLGVISGCREEQGPEP
jgi:hypothetical protein